MALPKNVKRRSTSADTSQPQITVNTAKPILLQSQQRPIKTGDPPHSPRRSPTKRAPGLTVTHKQALIDNLQLEVTERARKLRAQYALQAQGLRTRLEIRVHRIPAALRGANIADLLQRYTQEKEAPEAALAARIGEKRNSRVASISEGPEQENDGVHNPKKRQRQIAAQSSAAPQLPAPGNILSPRSDNPRPVQHSPSRLLQASPIKSHLSRSHMSPMKSNLPAFAGTMKSGDADPLKPVTKQASRIASKQVQNNSVAKLSAASTRPKRGAGISPAHRAAIGAAEDSVRPMRSSDASDGTTVVTKEETHARKGGLVGRIAGLGNRGKKPAASAAVSKSSMVEVENGTMRAGRMLRRRP